MRTRAGGVARSLVLGLALGMLVSGAGCDRSGGELAEIRELLAKRQLDEALVLLREGLAESPDDAALNLEYGRALIANGEPSLAVWSLTKAGHDPALEKEASLLLAQAQMATNDYEEAVKTLQTLLEKDPDHLDALRVLVEARLEARQPEQALEEVEHALDLAPDDLGLQMSRMRVFLYLDRQEEAAEVLADIRKKIPSLEQIDPEQSEFLAGRYCAIEAMFTHEIGESDKARSLFEECLEDQPTHPQVISSATSFFDEIGDPDAATEVLRKALASDPTDLQRRVALSMRLDRLGKPDESEALLREVTESQPDVWAALVDHYLDVDDPKKALEALDQAFAVVATEVPGDWRAIRADLLIQTGRLDEADRAIGEIDEEVYATTARGRLELARGNPAKALEYLERGIRLWPDGTLARYLAAQAAEQLGDFEKAESEYREAYRSDQAYTDAGRQLAELLATRGLPSDATTLLMAYLQAKPDDALGYERAIGYALEAKEGDTARSILAQYQRVPNLGLQAAAFSVRHLLQTKRLADAVSVVDAMRIDPARPENFELLEVRCEVLAARGKAGEAIALARRIRSAQTDRLELAELEAELLEKTGAHDEARTILEKVLEREPDRATALRALAALASAAGDEARAIELYERAAGSDPEDADSLVAAALLKERGPEREKDLRLALRRKPRNGLAAAVLADDLVRDGEPATPEASALLDRARRFGAADRADAIAARLASKPKT